MGLLANVAVNNSVISINVSDMLNKRALRSRCSEITSAIARLLSVFEGDDELIGRWELAQWKSRAETRQPCFVSGHLSILYRIPGQQVWMGVLSLTYNRDLSKTGDIFGVRAWWKRLRGELFDGLYNVEVKKSGASYIAKSAMTYRRPDIGKRYQGEFNPLSIVDGELVGTFANTTPTQYPEDNVTDVIFHHRKKWREVSETN